MPGAAPQYARSQLSTRCLLHFIFVEAVPSVGAGDSAFQQERPVRGSIVSRSLPPSRNLSSGWMMDRGRPPCRATSSRAPSFLVPWEAALHDTFPETRFQFLWRSVECVGWYRRVECLVATAWNSVLDGTRCRGGWTGFFPLRRACAAAGGRRARGRGALMSAAAGVCGLTTRGKSKHMPSPAALDLSSSPELVRRRLWLARHGE